MSTPHPKMRPPPHLRVILVTSSNGQRPNSFLLRCQAQWLAQEQKTHFQEPPVQILEHQNPSSRNLKGLHNPLLFSLLIISTPHHLPLHHTAFPLHLIPMHGVLSHAGDDGSSYEDFSPTLGNNRAADYSLSSTQEENEANKDCQSKNRPIRTSPASKLLVTKANEDI